MNIPENPGMQLILQNKGLIQLNTDSSSWNHPNIFDISFKPAYLISGGGTIAGTYQSHDYQLIIGDPGSNMSVAYADFDAVPVNFSVVNTTMNIPVEFYFQERDGDVHIFGP